MSSSVAPDLLNLGTYELNGRIYRRPIPRSILPGEEPPSKPPKQTKMEEKTEQSVSRKSSNDVSPLPSRGNATPSDRTSKLEGSASPEAAKTVISKNDRDEFEARIDWIPKEAYGKIIGQRGETMKSIKIKSGAHIEIPPRDSDDPIIVKASNERSVKIAIEEIEKIAVEWKKKSARTGGGDGSSAPPSPRPTHFLAVRFPGLDSEHDRLMDDINKDKDVPDPCKEFFLRMGPKRLHTTLCILHFSNPATDLDTIVAATKKAIDTWKKSYNSPPSIPLKVPLRGLASIDKSPRKSKVLYAKVASDDLQRLANAVARSAAETGLAPGNTHRQNSDVDDDEVGENNQGKDVLLHATLLNIRYVQERARNKRSEPLDLTTILNKFGTRELGTVDVAEIYVCAMAGGSRGEFYKCLATIPI